MVTNCSFRHNINGASKQKTYSTKVVKLYSLMKKIPWRPLNLELFVHKMCIFWIYLNCILDNILHFTFYKHSLIFTNRPYLVCLYSVHIFYSQAINLSPILYLLWSTIYCLNHNFVWNDNKHHYNITLLNLTLPT